MTEGNDPKPTTRTWTHLDIARIYVRQTAKVRGAAMAGRLMRYLLQTKATITVLKKIAEKCTYFRWDAELFIKAVFAGKPAEGTWFFGGKKHQSPPIQVFITPLAERLFQDFLRRQIQRLPQAADRAESLKKDEWVSAERRVAQANYDLEMICHAQRRMKLYRDRQESIRQHLTSLDPFFCALFPWVQAELNSGLQVNDEAWLAEFHRCVKLLKHTPNLASRLSDCSRKAQAEAFHLSLQWKSSTTNIPTPENTRS